MVKEWLRHVSKGQKKSTGQNGIIIAHSKRYYLVNISVGLNKTELGTRHRYGTLQCQKAVCI